MLYELEQILGFTPEKTEYYKLAFIHKSVSETANDGTLLNNERLEYLGDAILGAVIADMLFFKFPSASEGFLTQMRSKIVNGENLSTLAKQIGIDKYVVSNTKVTSKKNIFGDAFEAFIGAIYIDKGYKATEKFIITKIINDFVNLEELEKNDLNFKSQLIEWGQKYKKTVRFDTNENNDKGFVTKITINTEAYGKGKGKSKKEAEQAAAQNALNRLSTEMHNIHDIKDL